MTVKQDLQAARDLITDPTHWTQRVLARDQHGQAVNVEDEVAVCFCLIGALFKVTLNVDQGINLMPHHRALGTCLSEADRLEGGLSDYNDTHTHQEVLGALDRAISAQGE